MSQYDYLFENLSKVLRQHFSDFKANYLNKLSGYTKILLEFCKLKIRFNLLTWSLARKN